MGKDELLGEVKKWSNGCCAPREGKKRKKSSTKIKIGRTRPDGGKRTVHCGKLSKNTRRGQKMEKKKCRLKKNSPCPKREWEGSGDVDIIFSRSGTLGPQSKDGCYILKEKS